MALVTIQDLLSNKKRLDDDRNKKIRIHVEELGGEMVFKKLSPSEFLEITKDDTADNDAAIIYECCVEPNLKDDVLITNLKVKANPYEVIDKIMCGESKYQLANAILTNSKLVMEGKEIVKVIGEDIKN